MKVLCHSRRNLKLVRSDRRSFRNGVAPLEFVTALPVLLLLVYLMFIVFMTFEDKLRGVTGVRNDAFVRLEKARPQEEFALRADPFDGKVKAEYEHVLDWNSTSFRFDVRTSVTATGGTWDSVTAPFSPATRVPEVHVELAEKLLSPMGASRSVTLVSTQFAQSMNLEESSFAEAAIEGDAMNLLLDLAEKMIKASRTPVNLAERAMKLFLAVTPSWRLRSLRRLAQHGIQLIDTAKPALGYLPLANEGLDIPTP